MVSGKGYKGGPVGSVVKLATTPFPLQTISKSEQNAAGNESFMGASLPGVERTGGWRDYRNLSRTTNCHQEGGVPCNLEARFFFYSVPSFFKPYTDPQIVSFSKVFPFVSSKGNKTAWHSYDRRRCLDVRA